MVFMPVTASIKNEINMVKKIKESKQERENKKKAMEGNSYLRNTKKKHSENKTSLDEGSEYLERQPNRKDENNNAKMPDNIKKCKE